MLSDIRRDAGLLLLLLLLLILLGVLLPRLDCHGGIKEGENRPSVVDDDCLSRMREVWKMALCRFLRVERRARLTFPAPLEDRRLLSFWEAPSPPLVSLLVLPWIRCRHFLMVLALCASKTSSNWPVKKLR